jgi:undecaprenyl pyrophosphate phosphatase UppP
VQQAGSEVTAIAHVIQLAVAPVFLLTGVGAVLAVLTQRLARIIDRARVLEERLPVAAEESRPRYLGQLGLLARRARLIICAVIVTLFIGAFLETDVSLAIGPLFVAAMLALFGGLLMFLGEIRLAMTGLRIGPP